MASPQTENGFVRIANALWDEVIRRDFSKRQKDILFFIWRLSYGCQKRTAYIPRMVDFELCGISKTKVKSELEYLERSRVLIWNREAKTFEINKNYEEWYVSLVKGWDDQRFNELIAINLIQNGSQKGNKKFPKEEQKVPEKGTVEEHEVPKKGTLGSQKGNFEVPKKGTHTLDFPDNDAAFEDSKDIIKNNIKDSSSGTKIISLNQDTEQATTTTTDFSFPRIYQLYEKHFASDGRVTEFEVQDLSDQFDTYGGEWLLEAMREAVRQNKKNLAYINGILLGYQKRGGPGNKDSPATEKPIGPAIPNADETRRYLDEIERLRREKQERMRLRAANGSSNST